MSRSILAALKKELQEAREKCEDRDRMAEEIKILRARCEDRDILFKELNDLRLAQKELQLEHSKMQERVDAHDSVKRGLEHRLQQTEAALKMKMHALRQVNNKLKWEQRALDGQQNKVKDLERQNKKLHAEAKLDRSMREESEKTLTNQSLRVTRERSLRMLSIHRNAHVMKKINAELKDARHSLSKFEATQTELANVKRQIEVERAAKAVLRTIVENHERELCERDKASHKLRERFEVLRSHARELKDRDSVWAKRYNELGEKFEVLRQRLIQSLRKERKREGDVAVGVLRGQTAIAQLMAFKAPSAPTFPLGSDWGMLDDPKTQLRPGHRGLKSYMGLTHAFKRKMRGKSPQEICDIATAELEALSGERERLKERLTREIAEHEASALRDEALQRSHEEISVRHRKWAECRVAQEKNVRTLTERIYRCREERKSREMVLKRRILRRAEEADPYAVPRHLVKGSEPPTTDEAAAKIQSTYRAHAVRSELSTSLLAEEKQLSIEVRRLNDEISKKTAPRVQALADQAAKLQTQRKTQSEKTAKLGARAEKTKRDELSAIDRRIALQEAVLNSAREQVAELRDATEAANVNTAETAIVVLDKKIESDETDETVAPTSEGKDRTMSILEQACRSNSEDLRSVSQRSKSSVRIRSKKDTESSPLDIMMQKERGWEGGGHGVPRVGDSRRDCGVPFMFPMLQPPKAARREEREKIYGGILDTVIDPKRGSRNHKKTSHIGQRTLLGMKRSDIVVSQREIQRDLPLSTRGSARSVIRRVRKLLVKESDTKSRANKPKGRDAPAVREYTTPAAVGPGSYRLTSRAINVSNMKPSFAPFASTSKRSHIAAIDAGFRPGPGDYEQKNITNKEKRSFASSFKSKSKRFQNRYQKKAVPGPGAYDPMKRDEGRTIMKKRSIKKKKKRHENDVLFSLRAQTLHPRSVPSIPGKETKYGYEETTFGQLIPQKPKRRGYTGLKCDTIGPGQYTPNIGFGARRRKYKSTSFGRSRSKRTDFARKGAPGPGHYKVEKEHVGVSPLLIAKQSAAFSSKSSRSKLDKGDRNIPGPGNYDRSSDFDVFTRRKASHLQFFGSTQSRFGNASSMLDASHLGPGAYAVNRSSFEKCGKLVDSLKPVNTRRYVGFSTSTARLHSLSVDETPAPNAYSQRGFVQDVCSRIAAAESNRASDFMSPFGGTSSRFHEMNSNFVPGPGTYDLDRAVDTFTSLSAKDVTGAGTSVFKSKSDRVNLERESEVPDPGHYDITPKWRDGKVLPERQNVIGKGPNRFEDGPAHMATPGPGAYGSDEVEDFSSRYTFNAKGTAPAGRARRFPHRKDLTSDTPGPGAYDPDMPLGNLNTRTFNITIAEEMYN
eukprot:g2546.t1